MRSPLTPTLSPRSTGGRGSKKCCRSLWGSAMNRRAFLTNTGLGAIALADLLRGERRLGAREGDTAPRLHRAAKAKRVIFLFQSGGPSQLETFDDKPLLREMQGQPLPDSV